MQGHGTRGLRWEAGGSDQRGEGEGGCESGFEEGVRKFRDRVAAHGGDANLLETVDVYDQTPEWLRTLELDSDALTKAIIGTIGDIDGYQLPDAKGYTALMRHVLGVTREERQRRREEILGTTLKDVRAFADAIECVRSGKSARVVAVTSAERAAQAMEKRPGVFDEVIKVL